MDDMPPPPPSQLGESFASQYYGLLSSSEANNMHHFYSEHSTMILVLDGVPSEPATGIDQIQELISTHFVTIETKSIHSLECVPTPSLPSKEENHNGVLLVVSGFVKIKDIKECRKFVHTMFLAPHKKKGYFIMNDILHIITHRHHVPHELKPMAPLKSKVINPQFRSEHPPPVTDNGDLDESAVKRFERLMSLKVNDIQFPKLQQPGRHDLQNQRSVGETPPVKDEASSSNSSRVANADDTPPENMDAVQEEPPQISDGSNAEAGGRGSRRGKILWKHGLPNLRP